MRIEAARLREKLREYYDADGQSDPIRIDLPKGTYTPQIEFRQTERLILGQIERTRQLPIDAGSSQGLLHPSPVLARRP